MMDQFLPVAIVGGGPVGLAAAAHLEWSIDIQPFRIHQFFNFDSQGASGC